MYLYCLPTFYNHICWYLVKTAQKFHIYLIPVYTVKMNKTVEYSENYEPFKLYYTLTPDDLIEQI